VTGYSEKDLHLASAAGVRAPSLHNRQPWLFRLAGGAIEMRGAVPVGAGAPLAEPYDVLPQRLFSDRRRANGHDYEPEPLIGIVGSPGDLAVDQTRAGQALQRVLLTAAASGRDTSMISQPIEVPAAREQLRRALGRTGFPQIVVRFGYGTPGHPTPRRDLAEVVRDVGPEAVG